MNKKVTTILTCIATFLFFLGGSFLTHSSYIKTQELQVKAKLEQEKTKQEMLFRNGQQQMAQVTTLRKVAVPTVIKKRTNYEVELMNRMASVKDTDFDGSNIEMRTRR